MSSENLEIVHEGWLTKSPPAKRVLKAVSVKLVSCSVVIYDYLDLDSYIYYTINCFMVATCFCSIVFLISNNRYLYVPMTYTIETEDFFKNIFLINLNINMLTFRMF